MFNTARIPTVLVAIVTILLFSPLLAHGHATEVKFSNCDCKWFKPKLVVWIDNNSEIKYTDIAINTINEWHNSFTKLSYEIHTLPPGEYDILVTIHTIYGNAVGLPKETIGFATNVKKPNSHELVKVTIDVPVSYRNTYGSISKINEVAFHNMLLHEFGHAIGLGHAVENKKGPIDPMYHAMRVDEVARKVSKLDVSVLEKLYG